jgi:small subunit ribosomal protein S17e
MGRIKTKLIKRKTKEIMKSNAAITDKFENNKKAAESVAEFRSKKMRNIVAGYLTRLKKAQDAE